ncbi:MAG: DUF2169 domain-containing protein [Saccharospirillum sp.]|nr:DUF2169 domain-containing protein [Saccharospirillum sp.]
MHLDNHSNWSAQTQPGWLRNGQLSHIVVVKASAQFDLGGRITALPQATDLASGDQYHDESEERSLACANEMVPFKQGFEWLLTGQVQAAEGRTAQNVTVAWQRGGQCLQQKTLTLFGPRLWQKSWAGIVPGDPEPLTDIPLQWELAYGGQFESTEEVLAENPVGQGWYGKHKKAAIGQPMPQIEQEPLLVRAGQQRTPGGFGPLAPHWAPRQKAFTRLDVEALCQGANPYQAQTPADLYNAAPLDQRLEHPPEAGDRLQLKGFYRDEPLLELALPALMPLVFCRLDTTRATRIAMQWDTLLIDTTEQRLDWVFRGAIPVAEAQEQATLVVTDPNAEPEAESNHG